MKKQIYVSILQTDNGQIIRHNGKPSKKFLRKHPEFTTYHESGRENEFFYGTVYKIQNATLIEAQDREIHERELH